mgnify:FL=1
MKIKLLKSKIHRAKVTDANLEYEGSIAVDSKLMSASGLKKHEKVHVLNLTNGSRLQTYVIPDEPGSKSICINGAAAHLVDPGDRVIILSYCSLNVSESDTHQPTIIRLNEQNDIVS